MKIVSLKCPECGASLNIEEGMSWCFCSHCGTQIMLDDESQKVKYTFENAAEAGYQFEQGRQRAQYESPGNTELANRIRSLIQPAANLETLALKAQAAQHVLSGYETNYEKTQTPLVMFSQYWIPAAVILLALLMAISGESFATFFFGAVFAVALYFVITRVLAIYRYQLAGKIDQAQSELDQIRANMQEIRDNTNFGIVAEEYQTSDALEFFYKSLASGRALNMNQAILLYEDHLKNEETRLFQERQIELQRQQLEALRNNSNSESAPKRQASERKPSTAETAAAIGGALYAGAKFMKQWNKRKR